MGNRKSLIDALIISFGFMLGTVFYTMTDGLRNFGYPAGLSDYWMPLLLAFIGGWLVFWGLASVMIIIIRSK